MSTPVVATVPPNMKSVLKPLVRISTEKGDSVLVRGEPVQPKSQKYVQGVVFKDFLNSKKYVLLRNSQSAPTKSSKLSEGVKVVIRNNKIQSYSSRDVATVSGDKQELKPSKATLTEKNGM